MTVQILLPGTAQWLSCFLASSNFVDQQIGYLRRHVAVDFPIQQHRRRRAAISKAVNLLQAKRAVQGGLPQFRSDTFLDVIDDLIAPLGPAEFSPANPECMEPGPRIRKLHRVASTTVAEPAAPLCHAK